MKKISVFALSAFAFALCSCGGSTLLNGMNSTSTGTQSSVLSSAGSSIIGSLLSRAATGQSTQSSTGTSILGSLLSGAVSGNQTQTSTGTGILGSLLSGATSGNNLTNILTSVIGLDKVSTANLIGVWAYSGPGCAFTSESLLAKAGGEVVANTCKNKLATYFQQVGFSSDNTAFLFAQDGTFQAALLGRQFGGTFSFNESTQAITLNVSLLGVKSYSVSGYVKQNSNGIALLFEAKKILEVLQKIGASSGSSVLSNLTSLTQNYNGVRVGFDCVRVQ